MARLDIPGLTSKATAGGVRFYWQPSPKQRRAGWTGLSLGQDAGRAVTAAQARNADIAAWESGGAAPRAVKARVARQTMGALIRKFEDEHLPTLRVSTRHEYRSCLRVIERWTEGGTAPLHVITRKRVQTLKKALLQPAIDDGRYTVGRATPLRAHADPGAAILAGLAPRDTVAAVGRREGPWRQVRIAADQGKTRSGWVPAADLYVKLHRASSILRVLRTLMQFGCDNDIIAANPVLRASIPEAPARAQVIGGRALAAIMDSAEAIGRPSVALGIVIGLNTMQRQGDILSLGEINWRELTNVPPETRPILAGADGRVMGFRLRQQKTAEWIEVPVAGVARAAIERAIAANKAARSERGAKVAALIRDEDADRGYPQWKFQRQFLAIRRHARDAALAAGDAELVDELANVEFRDLRRTGMCLYGELGVPVEMIAAISGHDIDRTRKILKTYMPRNSRMAAAAVAMALQRLEARQQAEDAREGRA